MPGAAACPKRSISLADWVRSRPRFAVLMAAVQLRPSALALGDEGVEAHGCR